MRMPSLWLKRSRKPCREIRLKYNPRLEFVFDETVEKALRMERLLQKIAEVDDDA